jgi:hypothetical protein
MPAKPAAPVATPPTAGDLLKRTTRTPAYRVVKDAVRGMTGDQSFVARGTHVKSGDASLVHVNGESQTALPLAVVAQAIVSGVITDAEIEYLHSLRP